MPPINRLRRNCTVHGMIRLLIVSLLLAGAAQAQTSDRHKPLIASADQSTYSESLQQQTLENNVVIRQGSLRITADKIVVHLKDGAVDRIDANGQPVTFEQLDDKGELISGQANQLAYNATSGDLQLRGAAQLASPRQTLNAGLIEYNVNTQSATARGETGGDDSRVNIVIQPPASAE